MILAAGRGERMRPLSDRMPKPLLPVAGKPLIVWHLERLARGGFREIVINHAHLGDQIEALLGDGAAWGLRIHYSAEPQGALETAGGVVQALPLLGDEPFFLLSADIYVAADYRRLAVAPVDLTGTMTAFLWLVDNPVWHDRGDFAIADGHLVPEGEPMLTYANLGVFHPAFFAGIEPGTRLPLLPLIRRAMAERRILAARLAGPWDNIGSPEQLAALDGHLRRAC